MNSTKFQKQMTGFNKPFEIGSKVSTAKKSQTKDNTYTLVSFTGINAIVETADGKRMKVEYPIYLVEDEQV